MPREHRGVVAGAAPEPACRLPQLLASHLEIAHRCFVHPRGGNPGEQLGARVAALFPAGLLEPAAKRIHDSANDALIPVPHLEAERGFARDHVDPARIEPDDPHVGDGLGVDRLDQFLNSGNRPRRRSAGVMAQGEGCRAGVVLGADNPELLAMNADDARHDHNRNRHPQRSGLTDPHQDQDFGQWQNNEQQKQIEQHGNES